MSGSLSAAMEQGCWCELQGAYFANWKPSKMVIPYGMVGAQWWDAHFLSLDYGFGKSSASAHLHVRTQDGRIKTVGEFVAPHLPACEFAGESGAESGRATNAGPAAQDRRGLSRPRKLPPSSRSESWIFTSCSLSFTSMRTEHVHLPGRLLGIPPHHGNAVTADLLHRRRKPPSLTSWRRDARGCPESIDEGGVGALERKLGEKQ